MQRQVVAVVGFSGSGMSTVTKILIEKGFVSVAGRDYLHEIAAKEGLPTDRYSLIALANRIREHEGLDAIMRVLAARLETSGSDKWVFDSIRNPGEVNYLKNQHDAFVIGVRAPDEVRLRIMINRGKSGDPRSMEELHLLNDVERGVGQPPWGQNNASCLALSDFAIEHSRFLSDEREALDYLRPQVEAALAFRGLLEGQRANSERR